MRKAFGRTIVKLAEKNPNLFLFTGDVVQEMADFKSKFPERIFNLGLCEQSMISMAAGMALEGIRPVVYSITPFLLERPFEQIKIDIDEQNLPVLLIGYADYPTHGPTHRPLNAERLVSCFKNIAGYFPRNDLETERYMIEAYISKRPSIICLKSNGNHFL